MTIHVLKREGECFGHPWLQYEIVTDGASRIVELEPALLSGWNLKRIHDYGSEAWGGMAAEEIVEWRRRSVGVGAECDRPVTPEEAARIIDAFHERGPTRQVAS